MSIKNKEELERFWKAVDGGRNIFLTGGGGVGKSYTIRQLLALRGRGKIAVTATTGIAALNINGMTIHSWAGIGLGPSPEESPLSYWQKLVRNFAGAIDKAILRASAKEIIIIDEISMLDARTMDYLDFHLRCLVDADVPFGGKQLIVVGDFLQLPPVSRDGSAMYAFESRAWRDAKFEVIELKEVVRQSDEAFVRLLDSIRHGQCGPDVLRPLQMRMRPVPDKDKDKIRLLSSNRAVDAWNESMFDQLPQEEARTYKAQETGSSRHLAKLKEMMITPATLTLAPGAKVICTCNCRVNQFSKPKYEPMDNKYLYVNGMIGVVVKCMPNTVLVQFDSIPGFPGGYLQEVERNTWVYDPDDPKSASVTQIPLKLAWALTIHKSQGATLDNVHADISKCFEYGQAYVALSRCRSLEGLTLDGFSPSVIKAHAKALDYYKNPNAYYTEGEPEKIMTSLDSPEQTYYVPTIN